jgi:hypothetical protein
METGCYYQFLRLNPPQTSGIFRSDGVTGRFFLMAKGKRSRYASRMNKERRQQEFEISNFQISNLKSAPA